MRTVRRPVSFDPTLGAKPAETQQTLAALEAKLPATFTLSPALPAVKTGALTLTFFPEMVAQFQPSMNAPYGAGALSMYRKSASSPSAYA